MSQTQNQISQKGNQERTNDIDLDIFNSDRVSGPPKERQLIPYKISEDQYEELWTSYGDFSHDHTQRTQNVRSQREFQLMANAVGFGIAATIDCDNICSAKYGDEIILFYGSFKLSGQVDLQVKSRVRAEGQLALEKIKAYCK